MTKYIALTFLLSIYYFYPVSSYADTCPSIATIKQQLPKGWAIYDSIDGKPLSKERILLFQSMVEQFALAEWIKDAKFGGIIHCYYRDQTGSSLEAYLAKESYLPVDPKNFWYEVSGYRQCAAGQEKCLFKSNDANTKQFAKS